MDENNGKVLNGEFGGRVTTLGTTTIQHDQQTDLSLTLHIVSLEYGAPADV